MVSRQPGPDFIVIGQQKSATRWLYDQLRHCDRFWMPPIKELSYFKGNLLGKKEFRAKTDKYTSLLGQWKLSRLDRQFFALMMELKSRGQVTEQDYLSVFSLKGEKISGDVTPQYEELDDAAVRRVATLFPQVKIAYLIRHPLDRLQSAAGMFVTQGRDPPELMTDISRVEALLQKPHVALKSSPTRTWARWQAAFPAGHLRFWLFDDICDSPESVRSEIAAHFGAPGCTFAISPSHNRKAAKAPPKFSPAVKEHLRRYFEDEINQCRRVFGGRATEWT
jgi:hypothetical protein